MDYSKRHWARRASCPQEVLIRLAKGEGRAAEMAKERLLKQHEPLMLKIIKMLGTPQDLYEDALQAAREGSLKALRRYDPDKGAPFGSYAFGFIKGAVWDEVYGTSEPPVFFSTEEDDLEAVEVAVVVRAFVSKLSGRQRYLVKRVIVDDALRVEVARELKISRAAVTQALNRIFEKGRADLGDLGGDAA